MRAKARSGAKRKRKRHQGSFLPGEARLECAALELEARGNGKVVRRSTKGGS